LAMDGRASGVARGNGMAAGGRVRLR
jgi:hypothetical protein